MSQRYDVLIVGGGTGGLSVAARLRNEKPALSVALIEPSEKHYYQPLWTLVGAGVFEKEVTERSEADYVPAGVTWIRDRALAFDPEKKTVRTAASGDVGYAQLVVAPGIQLDWSKVEGLEGALGRDGVCSNYRYDLVDTTWRFLKDFAGGNAVFTFPSTPVKCAGAPQKILYLADDHPVSYTHLTLPTICSV